MFEYGPHGSGAEHAREVGVKLQWNLIAGGSIALEQHGALVNAVNVNYGKDKQHILYNRINMIDGEKMYSYPRRKRIVGDFLPLVNS